jgi:hypothetical protein
MVNVKDEIDDTLVARVRAAELLQAGGEADRAPREMRDKLKRAYIWVEDTVITSVVAMDTSRWS